MFTKTYNCFDQFRIRVHDYIISILLFRQQRFWGFSFISVWSTDYICAVITTSHCSGWATSCSENPQAETTQNIVPCNISQWPIAVVPRKKLQTYVFLFALKPFRLSNKRHAEELAILYDIHLLIVVYDEKILKKTRNKALTFGWATIF